MCCARLWLLNAAAARPAVELQAGQVGVEQQPWILCRAGEAFTNSRLFLHLGLSGLTWELVLPLFRDKIRFMRLARLQQK